MSLLSTVYHFIFHPFELRMTFEDYCKYFVQTCICRVVNTSYLSLAKTWHEGLAHGAWTKPNMAGGCPNNKQTFVNNPQVVDSLSLHPLSVGRPFFIEGCLVLRGQSTYTYTPTYMLTGLNVCKMHAFLSHVD